jgi:hypothetical protein
MGLLAVLTNVGSSKVFCHLISLSLITVIIYDNEVYHCVVLITLFVHPPTKQSPFLSLPAFVWE